MLVKIIQIVLFQGLFLLLYEFWLKKETFYLANRFYLLTTSVLAIIIPFISINISQNHFTPIVALPEILLNPQQNIFPEIIQDSTTQIASSSYLIWVYMLGIVIALFFFFIKLGKLIRLINSNQKQQNGKYILVDLQSTSKAFSFLNYIFIGKEIKDKEYLIAHEEVHVRQKHSLDLLWFEILKVALWFNPFIYLYQRRMIALHEFIADAESVISLDNKTYINHILNDLFQVENMAFINQFYNKSLIKKRIIMMTKNKSQKWKLAKYLFVIPMLAIFFIFSCIDTEKKDIDTDKTSITVEDYKDLQKYPDGVPFSIIEEVPIYPGCDESLDKSELKECLSKKIQQHVAKEFNVDIAQELSLEPGKKRIFVMFEIDKDGNINGIKSRAPHIALEEEAIRVIKTLPKMKPGKQQGENVSVKYSLPISFIVEK